MHAANDNTLAADLLKGADAIAAFSGFDRRTIYHFASNGGIPVFRVGSMICARKSKIMAWVEGQESGNAGAAA